MSTRSAAIGSSQSAAALRQKIDSVTGEMIESSESGEWQRTLELGNLRRDLLEALFQSVQEPTEAVALIERILDSDRQLAHAAKAARAEVADELAGRRQKKRALGAYREAASREI